MFNFATQAAGFMSIYIDTMLINTHPQENDEHLSRIVKVCETLFHVN